MVMLNVFSVTRSVSFGAVSVLFHAAAIIALCFSRRPISEFALVLLMTLGLDIGIAASGASTATGSVQLLNVIYKSPRNFCIPWYHIRRNHCACSTGNKSFELVRFSGYW